MGTGCTFHSNVNQLPISTSLRSCGTLPDKQGFVSPIFFPEDSTTICLFWQVFWLTSLFVAFPSVNRQTVAGITKSFYKGLQLRVQLRFRTGFPFQTLPF